MPTNVPFLSKYVKDTNKLGKVATVAALTFLDLTQPVNIYSFVGSIGTPYREADVVEYRPDKIKD